MDDLFDLDLYFDPQSVPKTRGSAEQSTAALIASSMNSEYTDDWSHRQDQPHNHVVEAPTLVQLGSSSYTPTSNRVVNALSTCSANVNGVGSFGLPDELGLPPMSAPTDNISFIPQFSNVINYEVLGAFSGEGDQSKNNGAVTYGNNGSIAYGDNNGAHGSAISHELRRIDGQTVNAFMGIPIPSKKDYVEETPYYTDLDIFKPSEEAPKNSDGNFLSPSIEVNNQYSPNAQSNVGDASSSKKGKSPRKTPCKKRKGASNENLLISHLPGSQNVNSDPPTINDYSGGNYADCSLSFPSSSKESNSLAFPQYSVKPESTTMNRGKVKSPRKAPSKKKNAPVSSSLKMKLKCEKSIGTDTNEWSISGETGERLNNSSATNTTTLTANNSLIRGMNENQDFIKPADLPESTCRVVENKTEHIRTPNRDSCQNESQLNVPSKGNVFNLPPVDPVKETRPPSTSKTKCPTARAPSYLTGFPMRCPEYPIVYCCNHCARIFTSIRGGQLHECVKKRPGRKAGVKLQ